jgi:predicted RNA-binding protein YlxR (DUF448 family)
MGLVVAKQQRRKVRHTPQRTCVACREMLAKKSLKRIVRTQNGVVLDPTGKIAGRGAYLHDSKSCWNLAISKGILARSLKTELTPEDLEKLTAWMNELPESDGSVSL